MIDVYSLALDGGKLLLVFLNSLIYFILPHKLSVSHISMSPQRSHVLINRFE